MVTSMKRHMRDRPFISRRVHILLLSLQPSSIHPLIEIQWSNINPYLINLATIRRERILTSFNQNAPTSRAKANVTQKLFLRECASLHFPVGQRILTWGWFSLEMSVLFFAVNIFLLSRKKGKLFSQLSATQCSVESWLDECQCCVFIVPVKSWMSWCPAWWLQSPWAHPPFFPRSLTEFQLSHQHRRTYIRFSRHFTAPWLKYAWMSSPKHLFIWSEALHAIKSRCTGSTAMNLPARGENSRGFWNRQRLAYIYIYLHVWPAIVTFYYLIIYQELTVLRLQIQYLSRYVKFSRTPRSEHSSCTILHSTPT